MLSRPLFILLAATLTATGWLVMQPDEAPTLVAAVARPARVASAAPPPAPASTPRPRPAWPDAPPRALLAWGPPPAPAAAQAAATPASAPPPEFPYRWIGRLDDGDVAQALLNGPQRSVGVRAGDVLDGRWRVDAIETSRLQLTWLPTGAGVAVTYPR